MLADERWGHCCDFELARPVDRETAILQRRPCMQAHHRASADQLHVCAYCESAVASTHAVAVGGSLVEVCSPCYLAQQVWERVSSTQRDSEATQLLTDALRAILEIVTSGQRG